MAMSNERLATKVDWEGGVLTAITYGLSSDEIADQEMAALWAQAEKAYSDLAPIVRKIESQLRQANQQTTESAQDD